MDVEIECTVVRETTEAVLIDDGTRKEWIPRSQINDYCESKGKWTSIFIPEWLATDRGLV